MILVIAGPSGVGKSRFVEYSCSQSGFVRTVPYTTRPRRGDERDGIDYHYLDKGAFHERIAADWFVDWDFTVGNYYGYGPELSAAGSNGLDTVVPVVARMAVRLRRLLPELFLLFLDGDEALLRERVAVRQPSEVERILREEHAREEREHAPLFDLQWSPGPHFGRDQVLTLLSAIRKSRFAD
jgi:guanylate kinase